MKRPLATFLAALLFATSALAGGDLNLLKSVGTSTVRSPFIYGGPTDVQRGINGTAHLGGGYTVVLGAGPTLGNELVAIGVSAGAVPPVNTAAGWVQISTSTGDIDMGITMAYRTVVFGDPATQTPFLDNVGSPNYVSSVVWEVSGTPTVINGGGLGQFFGANGGTTAPNFIYTSVAENELALFAAASASPHCPLGIAGSPWANQVSVSPFSCTIGGSTFDRYVGAVFNGQAGQSFAAGMLVLH